MDWLVSRLATELKTSPDSISVNETFFNLGLNSLNTLIVAGELGEHMGMDEFSPSLFWDHPTIEKLATFLTSYQDAAGGATASA